MKNEAFSTERALKLALEALERLIHLAEHEGWERLDKEYEAITAIKQALAAPVQKPVAWRWKLGDSGWQLEDAIPSTVQPKAVIEALYTAPPNVTTPQTAQVLAVAGQPLPCPFCGHIGLGFSDGETYRWVVASCGGCGASCGEVRREYPDQGQWHTEAIAEWNKRSPAAQRQWVGLTPEEVEDIVEYCDGVGWDVAERIEDKLRSKNT